MYQMELKLLYSEAFRVFFTKSTKLFFCEFQNEATNK